MKGSLGDPSGKQTAFLMDRFGQLKRGQTLILLTHHNGLNLDGSIPTAADDLIPALATDYAGREANPCRRWQ